MVIIFNIHHHLRHIITTMVLCHGIDKPITRKEVGTDVFMSIY